MDIKLTCPLGSECEEVRDNQMHRCRWYIEFAGTDATGKQHNQWNCSMTMMPVLQLESASTNRSIAAAIESARNVTDRNQQQAIKIAKKVGL